MTTKLIKNLSIGLATFIIVFLIGFGYYNFIYKPSKVIESVNRNVSILNENLTDTQKVIDNINTKYNKVNEVDIKIIEDVQVANNDLKSEIESIEEIIENNNNDKNKIDDGINSETKDFANLSKDSFDQRNKILSSLKNVIEFDTCLNAHYFSLLNSNLNASKSIAKLNEITLNSENTVQIIEINNDSVSSLNKSIESFNEIDNCINSSKKDLVPSSNSQLIRNDVLAYQTFVDSLLNFNKGLNENNIEIINSSQSNLDNNNLVSSFLKENVYQENIKNTNEIITNNYSELKEIEEKIDKMINEIKGEYNLETV